MNHRGAAMTSGLRFLLDTFSRDTAWHFLCSVTIRNHTWLFCTYSHWFFLFSCHDESLLFTETSLCQKNLFLSRSLFCFYAVKSTLLMSIRPGNPAPCKRCILQSFSGKPTETGIHISRSPEKRPSHLLFADISEPAMVPYVDNLIITWFII